jgi:uncharacterized membrane protein
MFLFLYFSFQDKYVFDSVFSIFSGIVGLFIAANIIALNQFSTINSTFAILIYGIYALGIIALSIPQLMEAMERGA